MKRSSFAAFHCSLAQALERMGDWWTPLIVRDLYLGVSRFDELVEDLGLSRNLLATRLKALIENGLVSHEKPAAGAARYRLTEAGLDLVPVLIALTAWGDKWTEPEGGPPILFRHLRCGKVLEPVVSCRNCGEAIRADELEPLPGPGGRAAPGTKVVARKLAAKG